MMKIVWCSSGTPAAAAKFMASPTEPLVPTSTILCSLHVLTTIFSRRSALVDDLLGSKDPFRALQRSSCGNDVGRYRAVILQWGAAWPVKIQLDRSGWITPVVEEFLHLRHPEVRTEIELPRTIIDVLAKPRSNTDARHALYAVI